MTALTIIVPTAGTRDTLDETIKSITSQMRPDDELIVDMNRSPWGNEARRRAMTRARGDAIMFQDDDDRYADGALDAARAAIEDDPWHLHLFRMRYLDNDFVLWEDPELRCGNVASQMICVPNKPGLWGQWSDRRESDFDFIESTCLMMGPPVWHEEIISLVRHPEFR